MQTKKSFGLPVTDESPFGIKQREFWKRVVRGKAASDCWSWHGARHGYGYGKLVGYAATGKLYYVSAHRYSYELHHGSGTTAGLFVLHRCDNPPCCNPGHLFLGTNADNLADCAAKGRMKGKGQGRNGIDEPTAIKIRQMLTAGEWPYRVAKSMGVSSSIVHSIATGKTWKHLGPIVHPHPHRKKESR